MVYSQCVVALMSALGETECIARFTVFASPFPFSTSSLLYPSSACEILETNERLCRTGAWYGLRACTPF